MTFKREWFQWIAKNYPDVVPISVICSAPNCENKPEFVAKGNFDYFLCKKCADILLFEKKYAAYEGKLAK